MSSCERLSDALSRVDYNGGAAGEDGKTLDDSEAYGAERWREELSQELREKTFRPKPVRQVLILKKQPGQLRPISILCIRDRVAHTSAVLVLEPTSKRSNMPIARRRGLTTRFTAVISISIRVTTRLLMGICQTNLVKSLTQKSRRACLSA